MNILKYNALFLLPLILGCGSGNTLQPEAKLQMLDEEQKIEVRFAGELFTNFYYSDQLKKPLLWPVISGSGHAVTRGYPLEPKVGERVDHPHHLGVWLNYGDVNGLDFWNNSDAVAPERTHRYGKVRHREILHAEQSDNSASITATADWNDYEEHTLLREMTELHFEAQGDTRIIDRTTTLTALDDTVALSDNKEGMFAVRVTRELELPNDGKQKLWAADGQAREVEQPDNAKVSGDYLSSEGVTGGAVWGTRARWMKLSGTIDADPVALVIYDHPDNVGYPTYWHARTYGLFSANPLGQKVFSKGEKELNFKLLPGESVTFRYRLVVFSKDPTVEEVEKAGY